jgi:hypothetical protein
MWISGVGYGVAYLRLQRPNVDSYVLIGNEDGCGADGITECLEQLELAQTEEETAKLHESYQSGGNVFGKLMRLRAVHILSFFVFVYVGVEVTLGGQFIPMLISASQGS